MTLHTYPVHFAAQMRQHLRSLRKSRGLTQAELGSLLGVSQARIAEIESKPGVVSIEQLMKILSALGVSLMLQEDVSNLPSYEGIKQKTGKAKNKPPSTPHAYGITAYASIVQTNTTPGFLPEQSYSGKPADMAGTRTGTGESGSAATASVLPWTAPIASCNAGNVFTFSSPQKTAEKAAPRKLLVIPPRKGEW